MLTGVPLPAGLLVVVRDGQARGRSLPLPVPLRSFVMLLCTLSGHLSNTWLCAVYAIVLLATTGKYELNKAFPSLALPLPQLRKPQVSGQG